MKPEVAPVPVDRTQVSQDQEGRASSSGCGAVTLCSETCQIDRHAPLFAQSPTYLNVGFQDILQIQQYVVFCHLTKVRLRRDDVVTAFGIRPLLIRLNLLGPRRVYNVESEWSPEGFP